MSGITKILTRTPSELGSIKTNKSPIVEENKQLPAEQWNTAADAIIEIQTAIGEAANPSAGSITEVLGDHEERIGELEQNGGGGGGTPDRIESASGDAFVESTDDFMGAGIPGSTMIAESNGASGLVATYPGHAGVRAGPEGSYIGGAGFDTAYDPASDAYTLRAYGAPLQVEEPTESNHAATKGYVDTRPGAEEWSEHAATEDVDLDGHKITGLAEPTEDDDAATKGYVDAQSGGGGPTDRIESPTGDAFVETTDDLMGAGTPGSVMRMKSNGGSAQVLAYSIPSNNESVAFVSVGPEDNIEGGAGFGAMYNTSSDSYSLLAVGTPLQVEEPTESNHAATKGYVDTRPGAEEWSEHAATEDVDLDGHKITGLAEPTNPQDAATKAYVDAQSGGGGTPGHVICNVTEDDPPIEPVPQRANLVFFSDTADVVVQDFEELDTTVVNFSGILEDTTALHSRTSDDPNSETNARASVSSSYTSGESNTGFHITLYDHNGDGSYLNFDRQPGGERFVIGLGYQPGDLRLEVTDHTSFGDKEFRLRNAPTLIETPVKPMHAATKGYVDDRLPELEWWGPFWTPVSNVNSVSNVECQYTRTYRAAGGSLVTLEGTIEVTPEALADDSLIFSCPLPVPQVGSAEPLGWVGDTENRPGSMCAISGGSLMVIIESTSDAVRTASFRISYRAA